MARKTFNIRITLDEKEFVKVEDHVLTTHDSIRRGEPMIEIIGPKCLAVLKQFEGRLTMKAVREWRLLSHALDQSCSYHSNWDDRKILEELIAGNEHSISWYVENCQKVPVYTN